MSEQVTVTWEMIADPHRTALALTTRNPNGHARGEARIPLANSTAIVPLVRDWNGRYSIPNSEARIVPDDGSMYYYADATLAADVPQ